MDERSVLCYVTVSTLLIDPNICILMGFLATFYFMQVSPLNLSLGVSLTLLSHRMLLGINVVNILSFSVRIRLSLIYRYGVSQSPPGFSGKVSLLSLYELS